MARVRPSPCGCVTGKRREDSPMRRGAKAATVATGRAVGAVMEGLDGRVLLAANPFGPAAASDTRAAAVFASAAEMATTSHLTISNVGGYPASIQSNNALR